MAGEPRDIIAAAWCEALNPSIPWEQVKGREGLYLGADAALAALTAAGIVLCRKSNRAPYYVPVEETP